MLGILIIAALIGALGAWSGASILMAGCPEVTFDGSRVGGRSFLIQPVCLDETIPSVSSLPGPLVGWGLLVLGLLLMLPLLGILWESARPQPQARQQQPYPYTLVAMKLAQDDDIDRMSRLYIRTAYKALSQFRTTEPKPLGYWNQSVGYLADAHYDGRRVVWTKFKRTFVSMPEDKKADFEWLWLDYLSQITAVEVDEIVRRLDQTSRQKLGVEN